MHYPIAAACAEFPNDNPALHHGAVWRCAGTLGAPVCERSAHAAGFGDEVPDAGEADVHDELDPFAVLLRVLEDVLLAQGTGDDSTTSLRALLCATRLDGIAVGEVASQALIAGNLVVPAARGLSRSEWFTAQVLGWQGILRGESEDFGVCGSRPLDEWAADVVARLMGSPSRAEGIRRELRRRGVAAFGLVADAA